MSPGASQRPWLPSQRLVCTSHGCFGVGLLVGALVGTNVGAEEGILDGCTLGAGVGVGVGVDVGASVGAGVAMHALSSESLGLRST